MEHLANFSVTGNAKIFHLLTKSLYDSPLTAAIREVGSNAIDASRENNIDLLVRPIRISIAGVEGHAQKSISFEDEGVGVSPERMNRFVASLGTSSKVDSSNQIGFHGIGMLSILALSDQFAIETNYLIGDTIKGSKYIVYLSSEGIPTYTEVPGAATSITTGTIVSFPIIDTSHDDILDKVLCVWGYSEYVQVCQQIGHLTVPRLQPMQGNKTLVAGCGFRVVGRGELASSLSSIAVVIQASDVFYSLADQQQLYGALSHQCRGLIREDRQLATWLKKAFLSHNESLADPGSMRVRLSEWARQNRHTALLILEFDKGEIDLPASREYVAGSGNNVDRIAARIIESLATIQSNVEDLIATAASIGIADLCHKLAQIGDEQPRLLEGADIWVNAESIKKKAVFAQAGANSSGKFTYVSDRTRTLPLALDFFLGAKQQGFKVLMVIDSSSQSSRQPSTASLNRLDFGKDQILGKWLVFKAFSVGAGRLLIESLGLIAIGFEVITKQAVAAQPKDVSAKRLKSKQNPEIEATPGSIPCVPADVAPDLLFVKSLVKFAQLILDEKNSAELKYNFYSVARSRLSTIVVETDTPRWYLPLGHHWGLTDVALICAVATKLGLTGSVSFLFDQVSDVDYHSIDPLASDLMMEIDGRIIDYLNTNQDKFKSLGFIPGIDANSSNSNALNLDTLLTASPLYSIERSCNRVLEIVDQFVDDRQIALIRFCLDSFRLNHWLFNCWGRYKIGQSSAHLARAREVLAASDGQATEDAYLLETANLLIQQLAAQFPILLTCKGVTLLTTRHNLFFRRDDISRSNLRLTLKLLTNSLPLALEHQ